MRHQRFISVSMVLLALVISGEIAAQGPTPTRGESDLEALLAEKAGIRIDLPEQFFKGRVIDPVPARVLVFIQFFGAYVEPFSIPEMLELEIFPKPASDSEKVRENFKINRRGQETP